MGIVFGTEHLHIWVSGASGHARFVSQESRSRLLRVVRGGVMGLCGARYGLPGRSRELRVERPLP